MILVLTPNIKSASDVYQRLIAHISRLQNIQWRVHHEQGTEQTLTEIYLIGDTSSVSLDDMKALPGVERVVRVSKDTACSAGIATIAGPRTLIMKDCVLVKTRFTCSRVYAQWTRSNMSNE